MKAPFRNPFSLSSIEQKGVFVLVVIILVLTGINLVRSHRPPRLMNAVDSSFLGELQLLKEQAISEDDNAAVEAANLPVGSGKPATHFYFDPNQASAGDLRRLGLTDRQIRTLINYRLHGGKFAGKEDLLRVYGLDSALYRQLAPWISIRDMETLPTEKLPSSWVGVPETVNLNLADSVILEKLPGIGPVLSRRIVRYRSLLGGFARAGQLKEVYGLSDSLFAVIIPRVYADTNLIVKINLNSATEQELARHPYIGKHMARGVVAYRATVGKIKSIHELKTNGILPLKDVEKLKIYLAI